MALELVRLGCSREGCGDSRERCSDKKDGSGYDKEGYSGVQGREGSI